MAPSSQTPCPCSEPWNSASLSDFYQGRNTHTKLWYFKVLWDEWGLRHNSTDNLKSRVRCPCHSNDLPLCWNHNFYFSLPPGSCFSSPSPPPPQCEYPKGIQADSLLESIFHTVYFFISTNNIIAYKMEFSKLY